MSYLTVIRSHDRKVAINYYYYYYLCYRTVLLSVLSARLSVTLVYCGQTVGWIKMPLGSWYGPMYVGLGPCGNALDGDPAGSSPMERGTAAPHFSAHFALARSTISATTELLYKRSRVNGVVQKDKYLNLSHAAYAHKTCIKLLPDLLLRSIQVVNSCSRVHDR